MIVLHNQPWWDFRDHGHPSLILRHGGDVLRPFRFTHALARMKHERHIPGEGGDDVLLGQDKIIWRLAELGEDEFVRDKEALCGPERGLFLAV